MSALTELSQDTRPIHSIHFDDPDETCFVVGSSQVTDIKPYDEKGVGDWEPWLAVYRGDEIWVRLAARKVMIFYKN